MEAFYSWAKSTENLNLLLASLTVLLAILTVIAAFVTLSYMRGRDLEVDTRSGWIEIHKAMINLRIQRAFVMQLTALGTYAAGSDQVQEGIKGYTLARAQLRAQLDRLNDDSLVVAIANFLDANLLTAQWQTQRFEHEFDSFVHEVAFKARPGNLNRRADAMADTPPSTRERLKDLNTKAYYLLVALSFVYGTSSGSRWLKVALTLTALVAVLPVQDYIKSPTALEYVRTFKIVCLVLALVSTVWWIWMVTPGVAANPH